jgi:Lamin Tail Domain
MLSWGTRLAKLSRVARLFCLFATVVLLAGCGDHLPLADAGPPAPDAAPQAQGDEAHAAVCINEVASDSPGTSDWIELHATATVDLSGYYLTDAPDRLDHFYRFPDGTTLAAGAYLTLHADGGATGAPFKLSREDGVYLLDPDGLVVDSLLFLGAKDGRSLARRPDGAGRFYYAAPSPGGANP